jgi:cellulose 1,4-beta-cellobiosidase
MVLTKKNLVSSSLLLITPFLAEGSTPRLLDLPIQHCTTQGGCSTESTKITLDANWRWYYHENTFQNCFDNGYRCNSEAECADCILTGDVDYSAYGIQTSGDELTLNFKAPNGGIGSRVYIVEEDQYKTFDLLDQELSIDVDIAALGCGLNGAVYFSEMSADGGESKGSQGAAYGTGYCDAQCPDDLHQVDGRVNYDNKHQCCNEMDIWEANSISNALTPHTCEMPNGDDMVGPVDCTGPECGEGAERYESICDKDGCDLNPYRFGNTDFYGPGKQVDTTRKFTITTRFLTDPATGKLAEIRRTYYQQNDRGEMIEIETPPFQLGGQTYDSITDSMCLAAEEPSPLGLTSQSTFMAKGGLTEMGDSFSRGMVLVLSLWDDLTSDMLWLDGTAEANGESADKYGAARGPCTGGLDRNSAEAANAYVKYSNIRYGDIGTTSPAAKTAATTTSATTVADTTASITTTAATSAPTTISPVVTDVPTTTITATDSECGFRIAESCWNSGCTVQVSVASWIPGQIVRVGLANSATITQAWNADVIDEQGSEVTVQLANYQSNGWGFNQQGSSILPHFSCGAALTTSPSATSTTHSSTFSTTTTTTPKAPSTTQMPVTLTPRPTPCGFAATERCWSTGCTVQVVPESWSPNARFQMQLAGDGRVTNMWNAKVVAQQGRLVTVQLANYNSDSFGFNQADSTVVPEFLC